MINPVVGILYSEVKPGKCDDAKLCIALVYVSWLMDTWEIKFNSPFTKIHIAKVQGIEMGTESDVGTDLYEYEMTININILRKVIIWKVSYYNTWIFFASLDQKHNTQYKRMQILPKILMVNFFNMNKMKAI